jgi:hypothetical protein
MDTREAGRIVTDLRFQITRVCELKEQVVEGIELLARVPDSDGAQQHFIALYGSLAFLADDLHAILGAPSVSGGQFRDLQ